MNFCLPAIVFRFAIPSVAFQVRKTEENEAMSGRPLAALVLPPEATVPMASATWCENGIISRRTCCAASCGTCGGAGCSYLPGGALQCCRRNITSSCTSTTQVACEVPSTQSTPFLAAPGATPTHVDGNTPLSTGSPLRDVQGINERPAHPHIVFILADDLGFHDLGYSGGGIPTPSLDKLSSEGVKLTNYYVEPTCSPSRASLMTGLSPLRHGIFEPWGNEYQFNLPLSKTTLAEALSNVGYQTHMVGKWHLGFWKEESTPTFRGFDTFYGFYGSSESYWSHIQQNHNESIASGYDFRRDEFPRCGKDCSIVEDVRGLYGTEILNERAKKIVQEHNVEKPLFLYFAWQAVHAPEEKCPKSAGYTGKRRPIFACMLMMADEGVGELVDVLSQKGMLKDTIIVFSSDNGGPITTEAKLSGDDIGSSNWPLRGGKHTLFEGGTRSRGFVWTGWASLSNDYNGLMGISDWFPTLANLANAEVPGDLDGKDQWGALARGEGSPHDHLVTGAFFWNLKYPANIALRYKNWKLIKGNPGNDKSYGWSGEWGSGQVNGVEYGFDPERVSLYDLSVDGEERHDLSKAEPATLSALLDLIRVYDLAPPPSFLKSYDAARGSPIKTDLGDTWAPWA